MPTIESLNDQTLAILAVNDPADTDAVFAGRVRVIEDKLVFCDEDGEMIPLDPAWTARIRETPASVKDLLLDCDYVLKLMVGDGQADDEAFAAAGLEWPEDDEESATPSP